jgi:hypothetical protein
VADQVAKAAGQSVQALQRLRCAAGQRKAPAAVARHRGQAMDAPVVDTDLEVDRQASVDQP